MTFEWSDFKDKAVTRIEADARAGAVYPSDTIDLCADLFAALAELARRARASRTRSEYDLRCQQCAAPHWLDVVLPSEIWNQIADPSDLLCLLCIDERLAEKGLVFDRAEFYFSGKALKSRLYAEDERDATPPTPARECDAPGCVREADHQGPCVADSSPTPAPVAEERCTCAGKPTYCDWCLAQGKRRWLPAPTSAPVAAEQPCWYVNDSGERCIRPASHNGITCHVTGRRPEPAPAPAAGPTDGPIKLPVRVERTPHQHLSALVAADGNVIIRREDAAIIEQIAAALNAQAKR